MGFQLFRAAAERPREEKASAVGPMMAVYGAGRAVWSPRDHVSLARNGYEQNVIGFRAVRMVAEAAAAITLVLAESGAQMTEHPVLRLLERPNPGQGGRSFLETIYGNLQLSGNAYIEGANHDAEGLPRELHVLRPDRMSVVPGPDGWPMAYDYAVGRQKHRFDMTGDLDPILHLKSFPPLDDHYGMSPLEAAASAIDVHNAASRCSKALLDNAARPSGAIVFGGKDGSGHLSEEQYQRLLREIEDNHQGARNAGRPLLLEGGLDWRPMGYGSLGIRDDEMQRRYLQAKLGYWQDPANMPVSSVYSGAMIPGDRVFVWTWDARPWRDFPVRTSIWSDGPAHRPGHWLTGRVSASALAEVVADICLNAGLSDFDVSGLDGAVDGYVIEQNGSARAALQPLMLAYGFDAFESGGKVVFRMRRDVASQALIEERLVAPKDTNAPPVERVRASRGAAEEAVRISYVQAESDYRLGASESRLPDGDLNRVAESSLPLAIAGSKAQQIADRWLAESRHARDRVSLALPWSRIDVEPGDAFELQRAGVTETYRVERIVDAAAREVEAVRIEAAMHLPNMTPEPGVETDLPLPPGPVNAIFLDLPLATGGDEDHELRLAVTIDPWTDRIGVYRSEDNTTYALIATLGKPALIGAMVEVLPAGARNRWQRVSVRVAIGTGPLESADRLRVLNGANRAALEYAPGQWEILQFRDAVLSAPRRIPALDAVARAARHRLAESG